MKIFKYFIFTVLAVTSTLTIAKRVEFIENPYEMQAPKEVLDIVEEAVNKYGFTKDYEVTSPKKPALEQNPWYNMAFSGSNKFTKNFVIAINPDWFLSLPKEQQDHFLAYIFAVDELGASTWYTTIVSILFLVLYVACLAGAIHVLGKIRFTPSSKLIRILIAYGIIFLIFRLFITPVQQNIMNEITIQQKIKPHLLAIEKTGNKNAAIEYTTAVNDAIKKRAQDGEPFFVAVNSGNLTDEIIKRLNTNK